MKIRRFLLAIATITVASVAGACAAGDDDDDDGSSSTITITGGNTVAIGATLQLTATQNPGGVNVTSQAAWTTNSGAVATVTGGLVTPNGVGQATITASLGSANDIHIVTVTGGAASADIVESTSFVTGDGSEIWVCVESQFDGSVAAAAVVQAGTCVAANDALNLPSTSEVAERLAIVFDADLVSGCTTGSADWYIDYAEDESGCEGCVNSVYNFSITADDDFGDLCGQVVPFEDLQAHRSTTTAKDRFTAVVGPIGPVGVSELIVYEAGGVTRLADCVAAATIAENQTGIFDADCTPVGAALSSGNSYTAIIKGTLGSSGKYQGRFDFDYVGAPTP